MPFFLADAILPLPLFNKVPLFIQDIFIRILYFIIEVCDIIIDDFRGTTRLFNKVCIDSSDNLVFVIRNERERIVNIIRIKVFQDRLIIIIILTDSGTFGSRVQEPAKNQEFGKAIDIVLYFSKSLIGREEVAQAEFFQDPLQQKMAEKLRVAEAVRAAFTNGKAICFNRVFRRTIRKERRNKGISRLKRFFQALNIVRLTIIKAGKRADV